LIKTWFLHLRSEALKQLCFNFNDDKC
jgi:hypothetical protein